MPKCSEDGITLVELIVVIVLLAVLGTLAVTRMGSLSVWQQDDDVRAFVNTWEFAFQEAFTRGETYRLNINIDNNSYSILREVPLERDEGKQVDYLENLRIDSQKKRLEEKKEEKAKTLEEEFQLEDRRQSGALDSLYYETLFADPFHSFRLSPPLEFPSLADEKPLSSTMYFRDVILHGQRFEDGEIPVRFSARAGGDTALIHLTYNEFVLTLIMNPATGIVRIQEGDLDEEWAKGILLEDRKINNNE